MVLDVVWLSNCLQRLRLRRSDRIYRFRMHGNDALLFGPQQMPKADSSSFPFIDVHLRRDLNVAMPQCAARRIEAMLEVNLRTKFFPQCMQGFGTGHSFLAQPTN